MSLKDPVSLTLDMMSQIEAESKGVYKPVYDELKKLDQEFPHVSAVHERVDEDGLALEYAVSNLLYFAHAALLYPATPEYTRKNTLEFTRFMAKVPGGRSMLLTYLSDLFPQAVVSTEHLYFLQRQIERACDLEECDKPDVLKGRTAAECTFPNDRIDKLRSLAVDLWKTEEDRKHAYENQL